MDNEETQKEIERKTAEEAKAKATPSGNDDPKDRTPTEDEKKTPSMIDGAVLAAEELKKQNDRREALLDREEALAAKRILGGVTEAGQAPKVETEDEKWAKDAKKRYEGTGMSPVEDDDGK